jgi:hypothetical protein
VRTIGCSGGRWRRARRAVRAVTVRAVGHTATPPCKLRHTCTVCILQGGVGCQRGVIQPPFPVRYAPKGYLYTVCIYTYRYPFAATPLPVRYTLSMCGVSYRNVYGHASLFGTHCVHMGISHMGISQGTV